MKRTNRIYKRNKKSTLNINNDYDMRKKKVSSFFHRAKYVPMTKKEIAGVLGIKKDELSILDMMLKELIEQGKIMLNSSKRYVLVKPKNLIKCIFDGKGDYGFGIVVDSDEEDIYIPSGLTNNAMNKDEIMVALDKTNRFRGSRKVGKVISISKRNITEVIGEISKIGNVYYLFPIDKKIPSILISNIDNYDKTDIINKLVSVKVITYPTRKNNMVGEIIKVIGAKDATKTYIEALYYSHDLNKLETFNKEIEEYLKTINDTVNEEDLKLREDRTQDNVFTIDSYEAKDLDDAISIKLKEDGTYILTVHIADVSHYVKNNTALDKEAISRATSIYIPGSVLPMLPKKLSNGICSLSENVLRLTLAVDMHIDKNGNVLDNKVFKSYIKSRKKMTYINVFKALENKDLDIVKEYEEFIPDLKIMKQLAEILNKKRYNEGSINFDIPETKVVLDKDGNVEDIKSYPINYTNKMIEEFMLITNQVIAKKFLELSIPFIYRIHEVPDKEKLRNLNEILSSYNKSLKSLENITPKMIQEVMEEFSTEEEKHVLSTVALRTLKLAKYSEECLGHFGLAFKHYSHFTSPIRRYPDLFIHRVISSYLENGNKLDSKSYDMYLNQCKEYSIISSERERNATLIERDFNDLYMAIFMKEKEGQVFTGRISSVTSFGMFVKLENTVEGLIHITKLKGYYEFDEKKYTLKGNGKIYRIGDKLDVILESVDIKLKEVNFKLKED